MVEIRTYLFISKGIIVFWMTSRLKTPIIQTTCIWIQVFHLFNMYVYLSSLRMHSLIWTCHCHFQEIMCSCRHDSSVHCRRPALSFFPTSLICSQQVSGPSNFNTPALAGSLVRSTGVAVTEAGTMRIPRAYIGLGDVGRARGLAVQWD